MLVLGVWQNETVIHIHISTLFLILFPMQTITEHRVEFSVLYSRFSLVIYFIHSSVYTSMPISQFTTPPPSPSPLGNHKFVLYLGDSISALLISSSVLVFQVPRINDIVQYLFFSLQGLNEMLHASCLRKWSAEGKHQ